MSVQHGLSIVAATSALVWASFVPVKAQARREQQPNILVIGQFNISAHNNDIMGYRTPIIDRIAKEGALFTD